MKRTELSEEDQKLVDQFVHSGIHSMRRKPFRPLVLLAVVAAVAVILSLISVVLERTVLP